MRFERGVDPEAVLIGADRACVLMADWCGARVLSGVVESAAPPLDAGSPCGQAARPLSSATPRLPS